MHSGFISVSTLFIVRVVLHYTGAMARSRASKWAFPPMALTYLANTLTYTATRI